MLPPAEWLTRFFHQGAYTQLQDIDCNQWLGSEHCLTAPEVLVRPGVGKEGRQAYADTQTTPAFAEKSCAMAGS